ncbi:hypothetical protein [Bacteroides fragilis]|uniref:hypothetical protein n=1 Tax=Bacteroides fragilis TaxID=817 RepID=UPI0028128503|nr:hypothetical protein [Bacteroides fragilis]WMI95026.1 hypothetical protein BFGS084_02448 [Bacteroides fragilis]
MILKRIVKKMYKEMYFQPLMRKYYRSQEKMIRCKKVDLGKSLLHMEGCVIFMADGILKQGGLADRLRGIVSLYKFCKMNDMNFKIHFVSPFCLSSFLRPNFYDWQLSLDGVSYDSSHDTIVLIPKKASEYWFDQCFFRNELATRINSKNMQYHVYTNIDLVGFEFGSLFKELFSPAPKLQVALDRHLKTLGTEYVSLSYRFLDILGDFKDTIDYDLSKKERENILGKCVNSVREMLKKHSGFSHILVTSDSQIFLSQIKDIPRVYIVEGVISHVDDPTTNNGHLKTFVDFYLISNARKIFLMRTKEMYKSSFARTAALINSVPFEEIEL